jgi:dolichyl-phosphate-mannose--protein O-mannosyl transferase
MGGGWLTWLINLDGRLFFFYLAPALRFFVLGVTLALLDVLGRSDDPFRRQLGLGAVCLYVALVAATFVFFYPVLAGEPLSHAEWLLRMWFPSWF